MPVSKNSLLCFAAALFISLQLASCNFTLSNQINVACDTSDLIQAVNSANSNTDLTTLILDPGCTYPFTVSDNHDGGQGPNALPIITTDIIIQGNDATLVRTGPYGLRFFFIAGMGSLRLDDLILENGSALIISNDQPNTRGGAVYNDGAVLSVYRSTFQGNHALSGDGGAIYNLGVLFIDEDCTFVDNAAQRGGAIFNTGENDSPLTIYNSVFSDNWADYGGALYNTGRDTSILIGGDEFVENRAYHDGGAIFTDDGDVHISGSYLHSNQAMDWYDPIGRGGAIYKEDGQMTIFDSRIASNEVYQQGGGIFNADGSLTIDHSHIQSNLVRYHSAAYSSYGSGIGDGGGIYNLGEVDLESSTVGRNWAAFYQGSYITSVGGNGGGIYNGGIARLENSTLNENMAMEGAGIYNTQIVHTLNCTLAQNRAEVTGSGIVNNGFSAVIDFTTFWYNQDSVALSVIQQEAGTFTIKNSLFSDNQHANCVIQGGTFNAVGANLSTDTTCPGFSIVLPGYYIPTSGFGDHGGPTKTVSLLYSSAGINEADCFTQNGQPVNRDQRGVARPQPSGSACDLGAFEYEFEEGTISPAPTQPQPLPSDTPLPEPMACAPQNTSCREGDSSQYEALGFLMEGECAPVVGQNQLGTWLLIVNPDWEGECWVSRDLVTTEGDVDGAEVHYPPLLPTKTPTEQVGCLVQQERAGEPVCVVPCPDGAEPGTPCTP